MVDMKKTETVIMPAGLLEALKQILPQLSLPMPAGQVAALINDLIQSEVCPEDTTKEG